MVLVNGRPLDIREAAARVPAVLEAWHPGSEGGAAVANVLFGDVNPGGKLPITWPREVGQIPLYYAHNRTKDPATAATRYWDGPSTPLYPFGYGLSYTDFQFSDIAVDRSVLSADDRVSVSVVVTNTGARSGDETAQLYIHQRAGRATRPVRELKGFQRVTLAPGERRTLTFILGEAELKYWSGAERKWVVDPGVFDIWIGKDSRAELHAVPLKLVVERLSRDFQVSEGFGNITAQGFKRVLKDAAFEGCDALGKPALGFEGSAVVTFQAQGEALCEVGQFANIAGPGRLQKS
ncbi:Periplasmic beta-glucosidase precursor [compost metagenome]